MRRNLVIAFGTLVLGAALVFSAGMPLAQNLPIGRREPHPVMHKAVRQLERVREELAHDAAHDFSGHRAQAIGEIDEAIGQLKQGIASDRQ